MNADPVILWLWYSFTACVSQTATLHNPLYLAIEAMKPYLRLLRPPTKLSGGYRAAAAEVSCFSSIETNIHGLDSSVLIFSFISCLVPCREFP